MRTPVSAGIRTRRFLRLSCAVLAGLALGLAASAIGPAWLLAYASLLALMGLLALFNSTPFLYAPESRYRAVDASRVAWPEALPILDRRGNDRLLFCIHGFPATPADFRRVSDSAATRGWDLAAPLLPGCGTRPEDLYPTNWSQYLAAARDMWIELRPRYKTACLVGVSVGGSLSLALAEEFCASPELAPSAMATVGSPAVLNSLFRHGLIKSPLVYLARTLGAFIPSLGAALPDPERMGVDGDGYHKGYLGVYPRQTYSIQLGLRETEKKLRLVTCPILVCHATGDRIIPYANQGIIATGVGSAVVELYTAHMGEFSHAKHNLLLYDSQRERVWAAILDFFDRTTEGTRRYP